MALFHANFKSNILRMQSGAEVILPDRIPEGVRLPVLYLLHGLSDDHTIWQRRTSIERYVSNMQLAVVMPNGHRSFYTDMSAGGAYFSYLADELPELIRSYFPISDLREDNFVAGNSMGGYGAFKLALSRPQQFAAAASLSGALDIAQRAETFSDTFKMVFGSKRTLNSNRNNLFKLVSKIAASSGGIEDCPRLYAACGFDDFLFEDNLKFRDHALAAGLSLSWHEGTGGHDWHYWDQEIQNVLKWLQEANETLAATIVTSVSEAELQKKYEKLQKILRTGNQKVAIAFSGGVDSTLLLRVAVETLGKDGVLAVIADSPSMPRREHEAALKMAEDMGAEVLVIYTQEINDPNYFNNPADRCYYCKHILFSDLQAAAKERGIKKLYDGQNADDLGDWRPGARAVSEMGGRSPLQEADLTKAEIRRLSERFNLLTATKPSAACLSSRVPYGTTITLDVLGKIEKAERGLLDLGFKVVRVRHHGDVARVELSEDDLKRLFSGNLRRRAAEIVREAGYDFATFDMEGYSTGSLNRSLSAAEQNPQNIGNSATRQNR